jgi:hypothetical protein
VWSYLRNIETALNYFTYKHFAHNLLVFPIGKICQTLGFSILKMSHQFNFQDSQKILFGLKKARHFLPLFPKKGKVF